ncbi:MAG TPA: dienelactone hydrolase family protein [Actinomycetota bacterium]|nr:dienelactone hydrolase family protein [Actinomycetota bacterium]
MPRIELRTGTEAELIRPGEGRAERGLVIYPDIMGLRPLFDDHVSRLATQLGWPVCAVEMFPGQETLTLEERLVAARDLDDEAKLADGLAAADAVDAEEVCVLGFCMGGMYVFKFAPRFFRGVSFYGMIRVPENWRAPGQGEPLDALLPRRGENVLAIIGSADIWTPSEDVDELRRTGATVVVYEGAEHGFVHDPDRPAHRPADATDAWRRVQQFLVAA